MRKPLNADTKFRVIGIWICINIIIGIFIALMLSIGMNEIDFKDLFIFSQVSVHVIATICIISAYALGYINHFRPLWFILIINNIGVLLVAMAGIKLTVIILDNIFFSQNSPFVKNISFNMTIAILLLSFACNTIGIFIERFKHGRIALLNDNKKLHDKLSHIESLNRNKSGLSINEKANHYVLKYDDIIYLSSSGKKSILHTRQKDYEIAQSLKNTEEKLPAQHFIRIHKQYIVNTAYINRIKYNHGGRYLLFLNDEDDTILPVGGIYTAGIRERLGVRNVPS